MNSIKLPLYSLVIEDSLSVLGDLEAILLAGGLLFYTHNLFFKIFSV